MRLLDRTGEISDAWAFVEGEEPAPDGPCILPFDRLEEALTLARARPGGIGLHLPNDADPRSLRPHLAALSMISVEFPSFADGRGFSIAKSLRLIGYEGRLRARGPVIADQFGYLLECGFDEVWLPTSVAHRQPVESWLAQLDKVSLTYQRGGGGDGPTRASILEQRWSTRGAEARL
ncbi:MAG: DUF934 domain-containing protein [Pseudomonadota bacterium]